MINKSIKNSKISEQLVNWYNKNKRNLPWRNTNNPYVIWISEIILQQTRVVQGYDYFNRFITRFPDIESLATAEEIEVLKLWQGLGYYSRARNLHNASKDIMSRFDGVFPTNYTDVLSLKGIGEYTAAAIVSFAYNQPYAVVDGNVFRVLSRLYAFDEPIDTGKGKKLFTALAQDLLDIKNPGMHNQAIMELGALQCVPVNPDCVQCPLAEWCMAYTADTISNYPVKQGKTKVKERFFNYIDIRYKSNIYLNKRTKDDIWKNLYELPLIETDRKIEWHELQALAEWGNTMRGINNIKIEPVNITLKHILSHRIIYATFYKVIVDNDSNLEKLYVKCHTSDLSNYPISRLVEKYFENID